MNSKWFTLIFPNLTPSAGKKWNVAGEKKKEKECGREGETTQDIAWLVHNLTRKGVNWNWTASLQMRLGSEIMNDFVWARLLTFRHVNDWYSKDMLHLIAGTPNDFIMWRCVCVRATYYLNNFVRKMYSGDLFSFGGGETTKDFLSRVGSPPIIILVRDSSLSSDDFHEGRSCGGNQNREPRGDGLRVRLGNKSAKHWKRKREMKRVHRPLLPNFDSS